MEDGEVLERIKEQINILNERLNSIFQMINLIDEYEQNKKQIEETEFDVYFATMYSYIYRYIILEFYRMNDKGENVVNIHYLKNQVVKNYEIIDRNKKINYSNFEYSNATRKELDNVLTDSLNSIKAIEDKVIFIRNKAGLAHGIKENFNIRISFEELKCLRNAYKDVLWAIDQRVNNGCFAFGEGFFHPASLTELIMNINK